MRHFIYILIILSTGFLNKPGLTFNCNYEKALISDKDFSMYAIDPGEPNISLGFPVDFDTLSHLSQIDTLRIDLCESIKDDCSGYISLKYDYRNDTIYIPAFSYQCNCNVTISRLKALKIYLNNDSCFVRNDDLNTIRISFNNYLDSLSNIFSSIFYSQFEYWKKRRGFFSNIDSLQEYKRAGLYTPSLVIELNDDSEIRNMKRYIDSAFNTYFNELNKSIVQNYGKELCALSHEEFKLLSFGLFFRIIILPKYQPPVFIMENQ